MSDDTIRTIQPDGWKKPSGYANGMLVPAGWRTLHVAGQIAWDADQQLVSESFGEQFAQALRNVVEVVRAAGGGPEHVVRMVCYVTDKQAYLSELPAVGAAWRETMGRNYPAMALVQVADLLEEGAQVEIEATAAFP